MACLTLWTFRLQSKPSNRSFDPRWRHRRDACWRSPCRSSRTEKAIYGLELAILIVATLGLVQASEGYIIQNANGTYKHSMDMYAWVAWWRTLLGISIGAENPFSAIITSEWASTESRGRMLAGVKSMQSFARLLAVAVGLGALRDTSRRMGLQPDALQTNNKVDTATVEPPGDVESRGENHESIPQQLWGAGL